jgi:hypothetical protein
MDRDRNVSPRPTTVFAGRRLCEPQPNFEIVLNQFGHLRFRK